MSSFIRPLTAFSTVAKSVARVLPENALQFGFALSTRSLAIGALTGVSALCGASDVCRLAASQAGEIAIDVLATGIAIAAFGLWGKLQRAAMPLFIAASLFMASPGAISRVDAPVMNGGQTQASLSLNNVLDPRPKLV